MITTLSAMRMSRTEKTIIGGLLALLLCAFGGCSSVRLAYNNAPQLAWWWIDGYIDFSSEQAPLVKHGIDSLFDWHRATQLPEYVALLSVAQTQITEPTTPALACRWQDQVREKLEPSLQRGLDLAAQLLPGLGEAQFRHLEQRYGKANEEMRKDFLQADAEDRLAESVKRALERAERLYGRLGEAQKRVVREGVAVSPFNPEQWLAERQRQQREVLQKLRRLAADKADGAQRLSALRLLVQRVESSPEPEYRAYQLKLRDYNCGLAAQIHNATTPAQRLKARENLKGWEADLRSLAPAP
jgi:hypothetical protein